MSCSEEYVPQKRPSSTPDSSDDDVPIAQLVRRHEKSAAAVASDIDDDTPLSDLPKRAKAKSAAKAKPAAKAMNLAKSAAVKKLVKKKDLPKAASPKKGAKKSPAAKTANGKSPATKKKTLAKKKTSKGKTKASQEQESSGDKLVTRSGVLYETKKGQLVQKLLCRWWYAMEWPKKDDLKPVPTSYEALEGYPGVYICVEGDDIGKLLDVRDKSTCPCFTNFAKKSSEELKELLETALKSQKEALVANWGENMVEGAKIESELKWLKSIDPAKADKAAAKALAQAKLS